MRYDLKEILDLGEQGGFAVPAFNIYNAECAIAVMQAAEETGAPVIFQMYSRLFDSGLAKFLAPAILEAINTMKTPAAFHLDHGIGEAEVLRAIRYGATGVMLDVSTLPIEENIARTRKVVQMAGECGVSVEGELGHIGSTNDEKWASCTETADAVRYAAETGVSALAIMVGTAHGHYKQAPKLAIGRIAEIHAASPVHLVLHGGSGVPDDQIRAAIQAGVRKINFGTDVCYSYLNAFREGDPFAAPLDVFLRQPTEAVKKFAVEKIRLLDAARK